MSRGATVSLTRPDAHGRRLGGVADTIEDDRVNEQPRYALGRTDRRLVLVLPRERAGALGDAVVDGAHGYAVDVENDPIDPLGAEIVERLDDDLEPLPVDDDRLVVDRTDDRGLGWRVGDDREVQGLRARRAVVVDVGRVGPEGEALADAPDRHVDRERERGALVLADQAEALVIDVVRRPQRLEEAHRVNTDLGVLGVDADDDLAPLGDLGRARGGARSRGCRGG